MKILGITFTYSLSPNVRHLVTSNVDALYKHLKFFVHIVRVTQQQRWFFTRATLR